MNGEEKILELIGKMYAEVTEGFKAVNERLDKVEDRQERIENEVKDIKKTALNIEQEHGKKLSALFDGHVQNTGKIDRIESEVVKHDEFILKKSDNSNHCNQEPTWFFYFRMIGKVKFLSNIC